MTGSLLVFESLTGIALILALLVLFAGTCYELDRAAREAIIPALGNPLERLLAVTAALLEPGGLTEQGHRHRQRALQFALVLVVTALVGAVFGDEMTVISLR
jgi:hypothetical protein